MGRMDKQIGHYRVVAELGRGGMGVVYRAHEESLNRYVAIKVLGEHLAEDSSCVQRFVREAQSAAKLNHPNIVQIYSIAEHEGLPYFVMEYVPGTSVLSLLRLRGHLETAQAVRLVLQTAAGLAEAHDAGIVHRDIKPANLLINERGLLKIADFGLALMTGAASRLTATGMFMGTPGYLSPEQCLDESIDHRTDIYSLGVTFFEMLTGVTPFTADSPLALLRQIVEVEPPDVRELNPDVDDDVRAMLARMMAKQPDQRYPSCHELIDDLQAYLARVAGAVLDAESVASGTAAAVMVPPPPASAAPPPARTSAGTPASHQAATPPPPPPAAPSVTAGSAPSDPFLMSPTVAMPSDPPAPRVEPIEAVAADPAPGRGISRSGMIALLLVLVVGVGTVAGAGLLVWRAGWLDPFLAATEPDESIGTGDADAVRVAELDEAGLPNDSRTGLPSDTETGATEDAAPAFDEPGTSRSNGMAPTSGESQPGSDAGGGKPEPDRANDRATGPDQTTARAPSGRSSADPAKSLPVAAPGSGAHDAAPSTKTTDAAKTVEAAAPMPEGLAVVGIGERLLAGEVESFLEKRLDRGKRPLVDERSFLPVLRLLNQSDDPDPVELAQRIKPHARAMLLAHAEYLGDRQLRYLGRMDTVYRSRLRIRLVDLHRQQQPEGGLDEVIEYNQISVGRRVEELLGPRLRRLAMLAAMRR